MKKRITLAFGLITLLVVATQLHAQYSLTAAFPYIPAFNVPTDIVTSVDGTNRLFITELTGKIWVISNHPNTSHRRVFLDMTSLCNHSSTGIDGMAFHPNFPHTPYFYVHYDFDSGGVFYLRVIRFTASSNQTPMPPPIGTDSAIFESRQNIITFSEPQDYHAGGNIKFGSDGFLYVAFGDGGNGGVLSQDRTNLAGKMIRIDVDNPSGENNYSIPVSNPYHSNTQGFREEIYAYGFRNPYRISFDKLTGKLWCGDVGEFKYEEIDLVDNGKNYGWNKMEGFHCYPDTVCDTTGRGFARPIFEYNHEGSSPTGCIIGGYVYRGTARPELYGKYIFGDCVLHRIYALTYDGVTASSTTIISDPGISPTTFGVDEAGEIYFGDYVTGLYKFYTFFQMPLNLTLSLEGLYNNNRLNMKDTVRTYLRNNTAPYAIVDSAKIVIDSTTFTGLGFYDHATDGTYYIVVQYKNGLETWSKAGGKFLGRGSSNNFYDFTTSQDQAYGNNMKLTGSKYSIYSGDVNHDGTINLSDLQLVYNDAKNFGSGYLNTDIDGNNFVDLTDLVTTFNNSKNFISIIRP